MAEEAVVAIKSPIGLGQVQNRWTIPLRVEDLADVVDAVQHVKYLELNEVLVCAGYRQGWD